jgi:hypothetical protein
MKEEKTKSQGEIEKKKVSEIFQDNSLNAKQEKRVSVLTETFHHSRTIILKNENNKNKLII